MSRRLTLASVLSPGMPWVSRTRRIRSTRREGGCTWKIFLFLFVPLRLLAAAAFGNTFDVPAGEAATTLRLFAAQSAVQIVYMIHNVRGEITNAVEGSLPPRWALEQMLEGTNLVASEDPTNGALVVGRKRTPGRSVAPPTRTPAIPRGLAADPGKFFSDSIVTLSPFEVRADEDRGYRATSTVAGTRLRSELKDLAASISVVTRDFIEDVNATDLTSLLIYTLGTEVGGYGGNFSDLSNPEAAGVFDDALGQASPGTRVRGLIQADRTRNYFLTDIPMDSYNIERLEISRGANANLFGLGSPAGIINTTVISAGLRQTATSASAAYGSYSSYRGTLDHNQVFWRDKFAARLATVYDQTRYRPEFAHARKKGATLSAVYQPFSDTTIRLTSEAGRSDSNRPELRPPFDRHGRWWAAGKPVWDPAAPGGGAGRLLGTPEPPFTSTTVFNAEGRRQPQNFLTSNWGGSTANAPLLIYVDPHRGDFGGVPIGGGSVVDGIKGFAENSALNAAGTALVSSGMLGLNSGHFIEQNVYQASNPLRTLFSREPMLGDPRVFDFFHQTLGGPTKYEFAWWEAHNLVIEQTFLDRNAGFELLLDRQRIDNGFTSPLSYAINLDPNERLPNGAPNPNFLRPLSVGSGFKRIYSQDREAARATAFYHLDLRKSRAPGGLGRHLVNASYGWQDALYQQFAGTLVNTDLDWREFERQVGPGNTSSTARLVFPLHYLGPGAGAAAGPGAISVTGLTAVQDPSGAREMTLLTHRRPLSDRPSALSPWETASFGLVTNGRYDVRNTVRNAQRYSERLEQQVRSFSAIVQSYWFDGSLVTTAGWRRDRVRSFDAGLPGITERGTADVRWDVFYPRLTRSLAEDSGSWGMVAHLPPALRRRLPVNTEAGIFYNSASNFRIAPQRYTVSGEALPSETGSTEEYGFHVTTLNGKLDLRVARYETRSDHATVIGLTPGINQLAMMVANVVEHNYLGNNAGNPAGIAAFDAWLDSPPGQIYRRAFDETLTPNVDPSRPTSHYGRYAAASGNRGQVSGVSGLKSTGYELELVFNPARNLRIAANAASAEAVRTRIAPELFDFLFQPGDGIVSLVQNPDGSPSSVGQLLGSPPGAAAASLHAFVTGNVLNQGIAATFAQEGTRTDELRDWSVRAIANYTFGRELFDGRLRGFSFGGAVRWSAAPVLGYGGRTIPVAGTTLAVADVTRPYFGEVEAMWDGWIGYRRILRHRIEWKVQLNLHNIGVGNELRPLAVWPDGRVIQWTIKEPQRWTLTSTFRF